MRFLLFILCLFITCISSQTIELIEGGTFDCSNITNLTPVENSTSSIQYLFDICKASPQCSKEYGLNNGGTLNTFSDFLFQVPPFSLPLYLQSPILNILCNYTLEQAQALMWEQALIISGTNFNPCGQGEEFLPIQRKCRPELNNTPNSCADQNTINIVLLSILLVVAIAGLVFAAYTSFGEKKMKIN